MRAWVLILCMLGLTGVGLWVSPLAEPLRLHAYYWIPDRTLDFESGTLRGWQLFRLAAEDAAVIVQNPVRRGQYAAEVTLHPGHSYGDGYKSELSDGYNAPFGKEMWYRVSHYIPSSTGRLPENSCVLAQWHNVSNPGLKDTAKPPLALRYRDGRARVTVSFSRVPFTKKDDATTLDLYDVPFALDQWHDFVYRVVFAGDDSGLVDIWHNGKLVKQYRGPVGYPGDPLGPYFKTGVYCWRTPDHPVTAYVDEYRRGRRRATVLFPGEKLETEARP